MKLRGKKQEVSRLSISSSGISSANSSELLWNKAKSGMIKTNKHKAVIRTISGKI